jgi:solute carrier family 25 (mitochondrial phosphate transporter), member 3
MAKFAVYEVASEKIIATTGKTKAELSGTQSTTINLGAGLIAGMAAAVISQPADTLLSKINKTKGAPGEGIASRLVTMAKQLGPRGLFTGMSARLVMIVSREDGWWLMVVTTTGELMTTLFLLFLGYPHCRSIHDLR